MKEINIKEFREKHEITQAKFSQLLGVSLLTLSRWERGVTKPSPLALEKLASTINEFSK